ncbi:MAG: hypothetical protein HQK53_17165 [Oligoflexia bacterium]|nr:hypothetical protein [Oligoflexia bacterium]
MIEKVDLPGPPTKTDGESILIFLDFDRVGSVAAIVANTFVDLSFGIDNASRDT